jgi:hypothetical protein
MKGELIMPKPAKYATKHEEKRTEKMTFRVTPTSKKVFLQKAAAAGLSQTEFLEKLVLGKNIINNHYAKEVAKSLFSINQKLNQLPDFCQKEELRDEISKIVIYTRQQREAMI